MSRLLASNDLMLNLVPPSGPANQVSNITVPGIVTTTINILLGGAGIISFIYLLWGSWSWIMAGGDKDALDKARKKITGALIGLALAFSTYALLRIVQILFGVNLIQVNITRIGP